MPVVSIAPVRLRALIAVPILVAVCARAIAPSSPVAPAAHAAPVVRAAPVLPAPVLAAPVLVPRDPGFDGYAQERRETLSPVRAPDGRVYAVVAVTERYWTMNAGPFYRAEVLAPRPGDPLSIPITERPDPPLGDLMIVELYNGFASREAETSPRDAAAELARLAAGGAWNDDAPPITD